MRILFVIPGDINLPTGGYRYDKNIIRGWQKSGVDVELISIKGNYPFPSDEDRQHAIKQITQFPQADIVVVDGLLGGASPEFLRTLAKTMPVVALIHHPLCLENGLDDITAQALKTSEADGLEFASHIITTSPTTSRTVAELFKYDATKIDTVLPGVQRGQKSIDSNTPTTNLLCVGSVIERKGHKYLLSALSQLKSLNWKLDCIGSTQFDNELFNELRNFISSQELHNKVTFHGDVSEAELEAAYLNADVFVLPSLFEGYGMAYAEAIVRGLPVIGTTAGAIPETVPESCGILIEPANTNALAKAIEQLISDQTLIERYKKNTLIEEPNFPTWESSANQFADILRNIT